MTRTVVSSLSLLMLAGIAPSVMALDISDSDVKMTIGVQLQFWAQASKGQNDVESFNRVTGARTTAGGAKAQPYDATNGVNNQYPAPVDFFLRRARLAFKGTYKSVWIYSMALRIDNQDKGVNGANRAPAMHNAYMGRIFKGEEWTQTIKSGLDYAFFCPADSGPSANLLLPAQRATQGMVAVRGVGVSYKLAGPFLTWGVDVQNNTGEASGVSGQQVTRPGMWYSTRAEFSPKGDWHIAKYQESFAGKEGKGVLFAAEAGLNKKALVASVAENAATGDINGNNTAQTFTAGAGGVNYVSKDTLCYGTEVLLHMDGLSALAEARWQNDKYKVNQNTGDLSGHQKGFIWLVQGGYAIPVNGGSQALELALRYTSIDKNTEFDNETAAYGAGDFGVSGQQEEAGLNWYFAGHNSKVGLMYTHWTAERGAAHENIVRLTEQLTF